MWTPLQTPRRAEPKIKWWRLKEPGDGKRFKDEVRQKLGLTLPVNWTITAEGIRTVAGKVLGMTTGTLKREKDTWWWNKDVQGSIKKKQQTYKKWHAEGGEQARITYLEAKRVAKRAVANAKAEAFDVDVQQHGVC